MYLSSLLARGWHYYLHYQSISVCSLFFSYLACVPVSSSRHLRLWTTVHKVPLVSSRIILYLLSLFSWMTSHSRSCHHSYTSEAVTENMSEDIGIGTVFPSSAPCVVSYTAWSSQNL